MPKGPGEIPRQLAEGYVFFDWFAIPQITARAKGLNEDLTRSDAAKAVQSIPFYVEVPEKGDWGSKLRVGSKRICTYICKCRCICICHIFSMDLMI